jgi:ureidoacrylate peracid hydrolase
MASRSASGSDAERMAGGAAAAPAAPAGDEMHRISFPDWAQERLSLSKAFTSIEPRRTALIAVDLQNGFLDADSPFGIAGAAAIVPGVNALAEKLRAAGGTIVFLRHTVSDDPRFALPDWLELHRPKLASSKHVFRKGSTSHELHPGVDAREGDLIVDKHRYSAMPTTSSDLHEMLQSRGINMLVVTGVATHACCESTARDAAMLDYKVIFTSDGTATYNDELQSWSLINLGMLFADISTMAEVEQRLV